MIVNFIPIDVVLSEIVADLGLGETPIPIHDFKRWIEEGLRDTGVRTQFRQEAREIIIEDYTGVLPADTYRVVKLLDEIKYSYNVALEPDDDADIVKEIEKLRITNRDWNLRGTEIITSFRKGSMTFILLLFPLDKSGFLLIPDEDAYKNAFMFLIAYYMSIRGHKFPQQRMNDMAYNWKRYLHFRTLARGRARMPDRTQMERYKNEFMRLIPRPYMIFDDLRSLGSPEVLNIDDRSRSIGGRTNIYIQ